MTSVNEIMTGRPALVGRDAPVADVAKTMEGDGLGAVIVCDENGHPCGVVTDRDLAVMAGDQVVGVVSQADIARVDQRLAGELVEVISFARDNTDRGLRRWPGLRSRARLYPSVT